MDGEDLDARGGGALGESPSASSTAVPPMPALDAKSDGSSSGGKDIISHELFKSVVKIFCVSCAPSYAQPWTMAHQRNSTSSGFFIRGELIMCNAHGVSHARQIRVRKHGEAKKYIAKVAHVLHMCDLALLTVEDRRFWEDTKPLHFQSVLPDLQDTVLVVGYPVGGDNVCVTKGVVSRVGFGKYSHSLSSLLMVQVDSAINGGNSGGPVFLGSEVVGVAFQSYATKQNIGYIIPFPVISHFLEGISRFGKPQPFVRLGIGYLRLESPAFKKHLGMEEDRSGVYVRHLTPLTDAHEKIQLGDVILSVDGVTVADDGTVPFRSKGERMTFHYCYMSKFFGEQVEFTLWRDGKETSVMVECGDIETLVPLHLYDLPHKPSYVVFGGLVFSVLSRPWLKAFYGSKWSSQAPLEMIRFSTEVVKEHSDEEIVVLSHVLSADCTLGYEIGLAPRVVTEVNGKKMRNMKELCLFLDSCQDDSLVFDLHLDTKVVLDVQQSRSEVSDILKVHSIAHDRSEDMPPPPSKSDSLKSTDESKEEEDAVMADSDPPAASASSSAVSSDQTQSNSGDDKKTPTTESSGKSADGSGSSSSSSSSSSSADQDVDMTEQT